MPHRTLLGMLLTSTLLVASACTGIHIASTATPTLTSFPCLAPTYFSMTVAPGSSTPIISLPAGWLIANGEALRMVPPSGATPYGDYTFSGSFPQDGDLRYRYMFGYTAGLPIGLNTNDHAIYDPPNAYRLAKVGDISWTGSNVFEVPADFILEPFGRMPHRILSVGRRFDAPFSGTLTASEELTITNGAAVALRLYAPELRERITNNPVSDVTMSPVDPAITYPHSWAPGASVSYRVTYQATVTNSETVARSVGITFPWTEGAHTCSFGPVWVDASFSANAT